MASKLPSLVSPALLASTLERAPSALKIIDASWYLPAMGRSGREEYDKVRIPGAAFFDIDVTDDTSDLPHMLPSARFFEESMAAIGVGSDDHVVCYDGKGLFSSARLWWLLTVFGHDKVSVLDGGLPTWRKLELPVETTPPAKPAAPTSPFVASLRTSRVACAADVLAHVSGDRLTATVVDARASGRFEGTAPEPRAGCRGGHIPLSRSLPFNKLLDADGAHMLPPDEIAASFAAAGVDVASPAPIVTSCGSGVTAAVLTLGLAQLGRDDVVLYDGSWAEWGGRDDLPLATGPAV